VIRFLCQKYPYFSELIQRIFDEKNIQLFNRALLIESLRLGGLRAFDFPIAVGVAIKEQIKQFNVEFSKFVIFIYTFFWRD